jgi:ABC-type multidrug transport system ATPase subunit
MSESVAKPTPYREERSYGKTHAVDGVDLTAEEGTILGVLGPNGAGKTTAVRILTTLTRSDRGRAEVAGQDVVKHAQTVRRAAGALHSTGGSDLSSSHYPMNR